MRVPFEKRKVVVSGRLVHGAHAGRLTAMIPITTAIAIEISTENDAAVAESSEAFGAMRPGSAAVI